MPTERGSTSNALRKAFAVGLIGLAVPVFVAILFTPSNSGKLISGAIGIVFIIISVLLLRSRK